MGYEGPTVGRGGTGQRLSMVVSPGTGRPLGQQGWTTKCWPRRAGPLILRPRGARENYKRESRRHEAPFVGGRHHGALTPKTKLPELLFRKPRPFPAARARVGLLITGRARLRSDTPRLGAPPTRVSHAHFRGRAGLLGPPRPSAA